MSRIDLSGKWTLRVDSPVLGKVSVPCSIPGDCHSALLEAGLIPDPYYGEQELAVQFLNQEELILEREFEIAPELLASGIPYLFLESIDTIATIRINGLIIAESQNMFHPQVVDLTQSLQPGTNSITIQFHSAEKAAAQRAQRLPYPIPHSVYPVQSLHRNQIRKVQCHSGWDWGPCLMVSGLYGACYVDIAAPGRIENLAVRTIPADNNRWELPVTLSYRIPASGNPSAGNPLANNPSAAKNTDATPVSTNAVLAVEDAAIPAPSRYTITMRLRLLDSADNPVLEQTTEHWLYGPGIHQLETKLTIKNPRLWWPAGYGDQYLYTLEATIWAVQKDDKKNTPAGAVQNSTGNTGLELPMQRAAKRVGFRDLKVITQDDEIGRSMTFQVNGKAIWAKGANWIPLDALPGRQTPTRYRQLLTAMVKANMNMVRVWGGGQYERDLFYNLCDELGILVWQDMMFSCSTYPADSEFLETVRKEIRYQILRLKEHPSIALWCGNNENVGALTWYPETMANRDRYIIDYDRLNEGVVGSTIRELDPDRPWWPSSPSAGPNDFSDNWHADGRGDMHYWSVWHEGKPFEAYYEVTPRFCSEFGYQSFPSEETVATYCPQDQRNLTSPVMEHHQKNPRGNSIIIENFSRYFRFPEGFTNMLYLSQVQQALAIKTAVEYWRSRRPICMGALYWQLNDCWPVASWSSLEYSGKWKLLHYAARRFFSPIALVSFIKDRRLQVHLINDTDRTLSGKLTLSFINFAGEQVQESVVSFQNAGEEARSLWELDLSRLSFPLNSVFFQGILHIDENPLSSCHKDPREPDRSLETFCFLVPPKQCNLEEAHLSSRLSFVKNYRGEAELLLQLTTDKPAFYVSVDIPGLRGHWEDNLFTLQPGATKSLRFIPEENAPHPSLEYCQEQLQIHHLRGTYQ